MQMTMETGYEAEVGKLLIVLNDSEPKEKHSLLRNQESLL